VSSTAAGSRLKRKCQYFGGNQGCKSGFNCQFLHEGKPSPLDLYYQKQPIPPELHKLTPRYPKGMPKSAASLQAPATDVAVQHAPAPYTPYNAPQSHTQPYVDTPLPPQQYAPQPTPQQLPPQQQFAPYPPQFSMPPQPQMPLQHQHQPPMPAQFYNGSMPPQMTQTPYQPQQTLYPPNQPHFPQNAFAGLPQPPRNF